VLDIVEKENTKSGPWYALGRFYSGSFAYAVKTLLLLGGSVIFRSLGFYPAYWATVGEVLVRIAVCFNSIN